MAAYNLNLRPAVSRASPVLYGLNQPSPLGIGQLPSTDKDLLQEPTANGTVLLDVLCSCILKNSTREFAGTVNKHACCVIMRLTSGVCLRVSF